MNALKNFVDMGGKITRQVGNHIFGFDGGMGNYEVLAFDANTGDLIKAKSIQNNQMADINSVNDVYDFIFGTPTAPDFTNVLN